MVVRNPMKSSDRVFISAEGVTSHKAMIICNREIKKKGEKRRISMNRCARVEVSLQRVCVHCLFEISGGGMGDSGV